MRIALSLCLLFIFSCRNDKYDSELSVTGYPPQIEQIIAAKCAVPGCHTDAGKVAAGGLSLQTWERMFEGSNGGAVVIPFRPDHSTIMYYTNHDSILPYPQLQPTMPFNLPPLTVEELNAIKNWVSEGAPDASGFVKFSDDAGRLKFYISNQGCDLVTIFDAASLLAMRAVDVGKISFIEAPHMVKVSDDNLYWYVSFLGGSFFQKYSVADNALVAEAAVGAGSWNTFCLSRDNQRAYIIDFDNGKIATVDLNNMSVQFHTGFGNPHGSMLNASGDTLYVTAQLSSSLFKIPVNDFPGYEVIDLVGQFPSPAAELEPHEIIMSPDSVKYFVTCQESNDVRIVQRSNDSLLAALPVGLLPQEMAVSTTYPYLFVTCMDAINPNPAERGSVAVINYQTNTLVTSIYPGYQPHGIAVDDYNGRVYVANRNVNPSGPAPHHASVCNGRNSYLSVIDLSSLQLIPSYNTELSVDAYSIGIMH